MPPKRITIRELRQTMKVQLESGQVVLIGTQYHLRGLLFGFAPHASYDSKSRQQALRDALKKIRAAIDAELAD